MRNLFYAIVLISLPVTGFFISPKSFASGEQVAVNYRYPYQIVERTASGQVNVISGVSGSNEPESIISDLGLEYFPEDKIQTVPDPSLGIGGKITIDRAPTITIIDWKKPKVYRSWATTVGDLLSEKGIELGTDDKVSVDLAAEIFDGGKITIIRVAVTNVVEKKPIDFSIIKKEDPNLDKGKTRVAKAGVKGEKELTYQVTREDGLEVSRVLTDTRVVTLPSDQIEYFGTKPVITVRCKYNDTVLAAAIKYKQDPNVICNLMMKESNGNAGSVNPNGYYGLFQYELGLWASASAKAGYSGADWSNPTAQIYTTCYLFSVGQSWRW